jgi:hypothetical protein
MSDEMLMAEGIVVTAGGKGGDVLDLSALTLTSRTK